MTHALIIGGGVAGTVTAMALRKAGIDATVYEARPADAADTGAFLVLFANGLAALRAVGADGPVLERSFPATRVDFVSGTGKHLGGRLLSGVREEGDTAARTLKGAVLHRALREEAARRGIDIVPGKRLLAAHTAPDGRVVASFAGGGRAQGDLLVGADGTHSAIRRLIDAAAPRPRYTGRITVCGYTPAGGPSLARDAYTMVYGRRVLFGGTVAPDGAVWWFANVPADEMTRAEIAAVTAAQWRERVLALLAEDDTPAAAVVRASDDSVAGFHAYDLASVPTWYRDSTVIVGDAAHALAPNVAQGASLAMEDGVVLAKCLRDLRRPRHAFAAYERLRRERVERVVAASADQARRSTPGPVGRALRDAILPLRLERARGDAEDWLTGYRVDWDEPVPGALAGQRR
ncbi:FAD-dependent monooxygenase [Streptomyces sp. B1866]|uniref:FAD-dependent oxidoreductase n=1 Tax=Streptomyces sp. B1866 TaxID=3075431 RepID=UPI00288C66B8|nr:FAD-dependent monooxygenase [Streptomyces sp. B1866]MDT3397880.1 FAD-dependent monooxygenase [Streptomyces sp. B1866]